MRKGVSTQLGLLRSVVIYYGLPWRRRSLHRFYGALIEPGHLVFDIGAHVGSRSRTLAALGARVVAVEPQPVFADFLERHLAKRLLALERVAVGREMGEIDLHISTRHPTVTSISPEFLAAAKQSPGFSSVDWDSKVRVPMTTLESLVSRYGRPDFCKIDVEGVEADILRGMEAPLPLIAFEYIPSMMALTEAAIEVLEQKGRYRFNRVIGESHRFHAEEWVDALTLRRDLAGLPRDAPSGDIYARLSP
ncbi:FkbM family methyltransferase [Rhizobium sp. SSA_523]|uniref:FkbM family methyltransferase n=1 Tax=Rhizobium sp. SSA_523 TaxID=2952477 RepID=UPI0020905109|nr:FkbM family methyltransferase [Rhizobium sp. SSA_523]MCO5732479.1 FkbM family methyltransferase [Rhizobium sp. SSA_523]